MKFQAGISYHPWTYSIDKFSWPAPRSPERVLQHHGQPTSLEWNSICHIATNTGTFFWHTAFITWILFSYINVLNARSNQITQASRRRTQSVRIRRQTKQVHFVSSTYTLTHTILHGTNQKKIIFLIGLQRESSTFVRIPHWQLENMQKEFF